MRLETAGNPSYVDYVAGLRRVCRNYESQCLPKEPEGEEKKTKNLPKKMKKKKKLHYPSMHDTTRKAGALRSL